jgi:hypothetical protein
MKSAISGCSMAARLALAASIIVVVLESHAATEFEGGICILDTNCANCLVETKTDNACGSKLKCVVFKGSAATSFQKHCAQSSSSDNSCYKSGGGNGSTCTVNFWDCECLNAQGSCNTTTCICEGDASGNASVSNANECVVSA